MGRLAGVVDKEFEDQRRAERQAATQKRIADVRARQGILRQQQQAQQAPAQQGAGVLDRRPARAPQPTGVLNRGNSRGGMIQQGTTPERDAEWFDTATNDKFLNPQEKAAKAARPVITPPSEGEVMAPGTLAAKAAEQAPFEEEQRQIAGGMMSDNQAEENEAQNAEEIKVEPAKLQKANETSKKMVAASKPAQEAKKILDDAGDSDNETDQGAAKAAEDSLDNEYKAVIAGLKSPQSAADAYEAKLKEDPWYEDNKVWGAALTFGLTLLAGADPRTALIMGAMSYGDIKGQENAKMKELEIKDADSFKAYQDRVNKLESDRLGAFEKTLDREDDQQHGLKELGLEQDFTAEQNRLDRESKEGIAKRSLDASLAEKLKAVNKTDRKIIEGLKLQDPRLTESLIELDRIQNVVNENPGAAGPIDQMVMGLSKIMDTDDYRANRELQQFSNDKALDLTSKLVGAISDKDLQLIKDTVPKGEDHPSVWNSWINRVRAATKREQQRVRDDLSTRGAPVSDAPKRRSFDPATGEIS